MQRGNLNYYIYCDVKWENKGEKTKMIAVLYNWKTIIGGISVKHQNNKPSIYSIVLSTYMH